MIKLNRRASDCLSRLGQMDLPAVWAIMRRAAGACGPLVRTFASAALAASDLKQQSAKRHRQTAPGQPHLRDAAARAFVYFSGGRKGRGRPRLVLQLAAGHPDAFYRRAAALQFGAVHGAPDLSRKSRAALKAGGLVSARTARALARARAGTNVYPAYPFFCLTAGQVAELNARFNAALQHGLNEFLARRKGAGHA